MIQPELAHAFLASRHSEMSLAGYILNVLEKANPLRSGGATLGASSQEAAQLTKGNSEHIANTPVQSCAERVRKIVTAADRCGVEMSQVKSRAPRVMPEDQASERPTPLGTMQVGLAHGDGPTLKQDPMAALTPRLGPWGKFALITALAIVASIAAFATQGVAAPHIGPVNWLLTLAYLFSAGICVARGIADRHERPAWLLIAAGIVVWAAGFVYYDLVFGAGVPAVPAPNDTLWLSFYPLCLAGLAILVGRRLGKINPLLWIDGLSAALVVASFASAFVLSPVFGAVSGSLAATATGFAYPVGDLLLLIVVFGVFAVTGWRPGFRWTLIAAAFGLCVAADLVYLSEIANGTYGPNTLLDASWPFAAWVLALAAWARPPRRAHATTREESPVWLPVAMGVVAVVLLAYGNFVNLGSVAIALALAALLVSMVAILFSLREQRRLRHLIQRDPLTGLFNHGAFHGAVELEIATNPNGCFGVLLADLDGFKQVNDRDGHLEGDRLLKEIADVLARASRQGDLAARIGGDEFAVLVRDIQAGGMQAVAERIQAELKASGVEIGLTVGASEWSLDGPTKELLLLRADMALYDAKPAASDGRRLRGAAALATMNGGSTGSDRVAKFLEIAREQLGMDLAYFAEFTGGKQVYRGLSGDAESFGTSIDEGMPLEDTYCQRLVDGRLPNIIRDTAVDQRVCSLAVTGEAGIGAYIGVPLRFADGRLYGTLCCASHDPDPALAQRDVEFMQVIARFLANEIERDARDAEDSELKTQAISLRGLLAALHARDNYTSEHSEDVVRLSRRVVRQLGLSDEAQSEIEQVALLHDIGKIGIPDAILRKAGPLTDDEWVLMRQHPAIGARLVESIEPLAHLGPLIRAEHERWDGTGYPDGLAATEIPLASRFVFVCDAYHAMTSDRPYRATMSVEEARRELEANCGTQFDPEVVQALLAACGSGRRATTTGAAAH